MTGLRLVARGLDLAGMLICTTHGIAAATNGWTATHVAWWSAGFIVILAGGPMHDLADKAITSARSAPWG